MSSSGDRPPPADYEIAGDESGLRSRINRLLADKRAELRASASLLRKLHPRSVVPGDDELRGAVPTNRMIDEVLLSSRLPLPFLRRTEVGPSSIAGAGRGLFATEDIANGDVITCYPGDALLYECDMDDDGDDDEDSADDGDVGEMVLWGAHVPTRERWDDDAVFDGAGGTPPLTSYAVAVGPAYSAMGHPALDDDPAYHGHYANDGAGQLELPRPAAGDDAGPEACIAEYVLASLEAANAMHHSVECNRLHVLTIATRDIQAGEEILVAYGPDYWVGHSIPSQ